MHTFLSVLDMVMDGAWMVYIWSSVILTVAKIWKPDRAPVGPINTVWKWSKWPAFCWLIANPVLTVVLEGHPSVWEDLAFVMNVWLWYAYKDSGDDDLEKKVKKKAHEIVQQVGGKLVVVPQAA